MKVTNDKYELPVAVAESVGELARMCNTSAGTIYTRMNHFKNGTSNYKTCPYIKVVLDE